VTANLPREFDDHKDWGKTKRVMNGLSISADDGEFKLKEHTHEVKNGFWKRYDAKLVDPQHQFKVWVANMHTSGPGRTALQLFLVVRLDGQARLEQWKDGVKLFNCTTEAECTVQVRLDFDVQWRWAPGAILGDLIIEPKVTGAELKLEEFDLKKAGKIEGWAARELGDGLKGLVAKELRHQEPKLVDKLNVAIAKKRSRMHLSADAVIADGWSKLEDFLGVNSPPPPGTSVTAGKQTPPPPLPAAD